MRYLKKCKKHILSISMMILILLIFTACGADIGTEMKFDKNFKGERIITALIKKSDLSSYVPTGADGIEEVVKKYIPESVSYKRTDKESGDVEFIFNISFDNLEDYTKKVTQILNKNPENAIQASILYDNKNNEFKKNITFEENFSSNDLLGWMIYGLKTENVVNYNSVSDWMQAGTSSLEIENQSYDVYGKFRVKQSESTSFDEIKVLTEILKDGSFKRSITFSILERNVKALSDKGIVLDEYLKNLSPKESEFKETKEQGIVEYTISFTSKTSQELSSNTDKLFKSENSVFTIVYSSYDDNKNSVRVDLTEYLDASYYLNYDGNKLESNLQLYEGMSLDFGNSSNAIYISRYEDGEIFSYNPNFYDTYNFTFSMPVKFENVGLNIDINKNKILEKLSMSISGNLPAALTEIVEKNIKSSVKSDKINVDVKREESSITYTLSLDGTTEEVSSEFKSFLSNYTGSNINHEISYTEVESKSLFKAEHSLSVVVDLPRLNAEKIDFYCKPSTARKLQVLEASNIKELENSTDKSIVSEVDGGIIRFYALETGVKLISVIILVIAIIIIAILLWYIISKREKIKASFKSTNKSHGASASSGGASALTNTNEEEFDEDEFI